MANISSLAVQLTARVGGFTSGMAKAGRGMRSLTNPLSAAGGVLSRFNGLMAGIGAGVSVAGFVAGIRKAANEIDDLGKMADRLGMSVGGLGTMRIAANLAGLEINQVQTSMRKMLNATSEASHGIGQAGKSLKELGLDAQKLAQLKPEQQFMAIKSRLEGIGNAGDRVRLAMDIFGKDGSLMLNLMVSDLADAEQRMNGFGLALSRAEVSKIEEANDAVLLVSEALKGMFTQVAVQLAPAITDLSNRFTQWAMEGGGMTVKVAEALDWLGNVVLENMRAIDIYFKIFKSGAWGLGYVLHKAIIETLILAEGAAKRLFGWMDKIPGVDFPEMFPAEELRSFANEFKRMADMNSGEAIEAMMTPPDASQFAIKLKNWWGEVQAQADLNAQSKANSPDSIVGDTITDDMRSQAEKLIEGTRTPFEQFRSEVAEIQSLYQNGLIDQTTYNRGVAQAAEKFGKAGGNAKDARKEIDALNKALDPGSFASDATGLALRGRKEGVRGPMSIRDMVKSKPATDAASGVTGNGANTQQMVQLLQQLVMQGFQPTDARLMA